jgi:hypothetical protein
LSIYPTVGFFTQKPLPNLPVPDLHETLKKYLLCIKPIVSADQYERTCQYVSEFGKPGGDGEKLQRNLQKFAENSVNWVLLLLLVLLEIQLCLVGERERERELRMRISFGFLQSFFNT